MADLESEHPGEIVEKRIIVYSGDAGANSEGPNVVTSVRSSSSWRSEAIFRKIDDVDQGKEFNDNLAEMEDDALAVFFSRAADLGIQDRAFREYEGPGLPLDYYTHLSHSVDLVLSCVQITREKVRPIRVANVFAVARKIKTNPESVVELQKLASDLRARIADLTK
jgi:hypothetical protein